MYEENLIKEKILSTIRYLSKISPIIFVGIFALLVFGATVFYSFQKPYITSENNLNSTIQDKKSDQPSEPDKEQAKAEIRKKPPKLATSGSSKRSGNITIVSDGSISADDASKLQGYAGSGPAGNITYTDTTGAYPGLGDTLKSYINSTLYHKSSDLSYMYEIKMVDCAGCGYGGLYSGAYLISGSDIYKAYGFITLNVAPYKSSPYFEDYMKLILSHEYGHHYTLYHRWVDLDIPYGERFPDAYYNVRPLTKATTASDYSLGWGNCDVEIIAEDYSFFFSGYGYHAMAGTYGLPSGGTSSWIQNMSVEASPPADGTPPTVSITSPANGATISGSVVVSANASDNVAVTRVEIYLDSNLIATLPSSPYQTSLNTLSYSNASHTIKAKAYDSSQSTETTISITINNIGGDTEAPSIIINQPAGNPYSWPSGDLIIEATGIDNVAVTKTEFYIDDYLVAEESFGYIIRLWLFAGTPAGSYTLKAKAYDAAGNSGQSSITINKS